MNVGYVNKDVAAMYGIPYSELTDEQKRILHEDSVRRSKLIKERETAVLRNNLKAFEDEAKMEKVLASLYKNCQKSILADVAETIAKVQKDGGTWSYANQSALTRSRGLFEQINTELGKLGIKEQSVFTEGLSSIYTDQFKRTVYTLGQSIVVSTDFAKLNPALVKKTLDYPWSGAMFSDRLWNDKATLGRNLRAGLTQSMILGEDMRKISDRINKNIDTAENNAMRVARTETKRVCYVANNDVFEDCGVDRVKYMCANSVKGGGGDSRVCKYCRSMDGEIYKRGDEPMLPIHPNCRCWYVPVVEDTFKDNELNELTGSIRGAENFEKWEKAQREKDVTPKTPKTPIEKEDSPKDEKLVKALDQLDIDYKAKNMKVDDLRAEYDDLQAKYSANSTVRRGLLSPVEGGFKDMAEFRAVDAEMSERLRQIKDNLETAQEQLKDLMMDRQFLLKGGAEKVDSLDGYRDIRAALKKARGFDYVKYGDELMDVVAGMDVEQIALQRLYYKEGSVADWSNLSPKKVFKDGAVSNIRIRCMVDKIDYKEVKKLDKTLSTDEIILKLGGGDLTKGSCSSLAFSYAGNKNGFDVIDFRGGDSQWFFSQNSNIRDVAKLPNVISYIVSNSNDYKAVKELLQNVEAGKEYYLATGAHAAIIRKTETGFEYLELQSRNNNGFHELTKERLKNRFGCKQSRSMSLLGKRVKLEGKSELIDISSLNSKEFQKLLGYINTDVSKQKKGVGGYAK